MPVVPALVNVSSYCGFPPLVRAFRSTRSAVLAAEPRAKATCTRNAESPAGIFNNKRPLASVAVCKAKPSPSVASATFRPSALSADPPSVPAVTAPASSAKSTTRSCLRGPICQWRTIEPSLCVTASKMRAPSTSDSTTTSWPFL